MGISLSETKCSCTEDSGLEVWNPGLKMPDKVSWKRCLVFCFCFRFFFTVYHFWNEVKYFARPLKCSKKLGMLMKHPNYIRSHKSTKKLCHPLSSPLGHTSWFVCCVTAGLRSTAYPCPSQCHFQPGEVIVPLVLADKSPHILQSFLPAGQQ